MKKIKKFIIKRSFLFHLFLPFLLIADEILLEKIIAGMKNQENLLKDWKAKCYITIKTDKGEIIKEQEIWAQKGEKLYREKKKEEGGFSYIVTFDGELLRIVGENKKGLVKMPTETDLRKAFLGATSPISFFRVLRFENKPIHSFLLENNKGKTVEVVGKVKLGGEECYLIKSIVQKEAGEFKYLFYISPFYGFNPLRIEMEEKWEKDNEYTKGKSITENVYEKYNNIWFLKKSKVESSLEFKTSDKEYSGYTIYEVELKDVEINKEIPDSFFQIEFPKGTKVYDDRTGMTYIVE